MVKVNTHRDSPSEYDDIIDKNRPRLRGEPKIPMAERAGQFSPFSALTGFHDMIDDAELEFGRTRG